AVQSEAHKDGLAVQFLFEQGNDRDTAPATLWNGSFPKSGLIGFSGGPISVVVHRRYVPLPPVVWTNGNGYPCRGNTFKMGLKELGDFHPILMGHQTHGYFCVRLTGDHRFGTCSSIAAPDAVHVQGRANGVAFVRGIPFFAIYCLYV